MINQQGFLFYGQWFSKHHSAQNAELFCPFRTLCSSFCVSTNNLLEFTQIGSFLFRKTWVYHDQFQSLPYPKFWVAMCFVRNCNEKKTKIYTDKNRSAADSNSCFLASSCIMSFTANQLKTETKHTFLFWNLPTLTYSKFKTRKLFFLGQIRT